MLVGSVWQWRKSATGAQNGSPVKRLPLGPQAGSRGHCVEWGWGCGGDMWWVQLDSKAWGGVSPVVGLKSLWGCTLKVYTEWMGGWGCCWGVWMGGIGDGVEFKGRCLVEGWGRARAIWIRL